MIAYSLKMKVLLPFFTVLQIHNMHVTSFIESFCVTVSQCALFVIVRYSYRELKPIGGPGATPSRGSTAGARPARAYTVSSTTRPASSAAWGTIPSKSGSPRWWASVSILPANSWISEIICPINNIAIPVQ